MSNMVYIYVLQLLKDYYYVGKTDNPQYRLETHFESGGSVFTKRFRPKQIHALHPDCSDHDETRITLDYMKKYGIQKVRGGPWTQILLTDAEEEFIQKMIDSESDNCYRCGEAGHFANKCPKVSPKVSHQKKKTNSCDRCQRQGHTEETCYAKTNAKGYKINDSKEVWVCEFCGSEFDTKKGCSFHENIHCTKRRTKGKQNLQKASQDLWDEVNESSSDYSDDEDEIVCYRCGIPGHYATTCHVRI
jgi:predicted GIY-YIG superfamily endonuclease